MSKGERDEIFPDRSPDGNALFFGNIWQRRSPSAIYRFDLETREVKTVNNSEGVNSPEYLGIQDKNHEVLKFILGGTLWRIVGF